MKRDPLLWGALAAALAVTASAEYGLARAAGFGLYVAAGVPAAMDIYALRALRARRDVAAAVLAMIAVNAAAHLVAAGRLPLSVPLVVAVSAIAPLVLWRVHRLAEHVADRPSTGAEVNTQHANLDNIQDSPAAAEPLVICGGRRVYALAVPPVEDGEEVDTEDGGRLGAEAARVVIEGCWATGLSVREAARLSTRSPSYVAKVFARLEDERGPRPETPLAAADTRA